MLGNGLAFPGIDDAMELLPAIIRLFKDKQI